MPKMAGQHNVKPKKRKSSSETRGSRKVSRTGKRCLKSQGTLSKAEGSSVVTTSKKAEPLERLSGISCECHQAAGRRRCSASPDLRGQEGKENELRIEQEFDTCRNVWNKQEPERMDCEGTDKIVFPDDDSNQILPVEQFFGNLDIVQDFPQKSSASSSSVQRQKRRRHYYALEDSDEEDIVLGSI